MRRPFQTTLNKLLRFSGVGQHTGAPTTITLHPSAPNSGIQFHTGNTLIPATFENADLTSMYTLLRSPSMPYTTLYNVEHLLAAVSAAGVDNLRVGVTSSELPIMDGSASAFATALARASSPQSVARRVVVVRRPVQVSLERHVASLRPPLDDDDEALTLDVAIDFGRRLIAGDGAKQRVLFRLSENGFRDRIARARTFCFSEDVQRLRNSGYQRGTTVDNALVFASDGRPVNSDGLRYSDEPCRHKVLDCLGQLRLGGVLVGHYRATTPLQSLNIALLRELYKNPDNYSIEEG